MDHIITEVTILNYESHLRAEERSEGTIQKYLRDIYHFYNYLPKKQCVNKDAVIRYKEVLAEKYAVSTANSMLAAINSLFAFVGWYDCRVKPFKQQRRIFRDQERELTKAEYIRLLNAARSKGNERLFYIMETLCVTGIRISELQYITVDAVKNGTTIVNCKGKQRTILLTKKLCSALSFYCKKYGITAGPIFVTRTGRPMNRSNVWAEMKRLCESAGVEASKVFPHNFRHLFAVTFYSLEKDIAKLADLLGHASIETTRIYIMESCESHIRQMDKMGLVI